MTIDRPPLIILLGPTAVGKTEISLQLADTINGEIVSADSRLFYRGMDIGTAKPSLGERARVPHHLIDMVEVDAPWSLALFLQAAFECIDGIHKRGRIPILVGGTGQYVSSIVEGWLIPVQEPDPRLRAALNTWAEEISPAEIHRRLSVIDPAAAARIDSRNLRRTVRALEVIFHTGRKFSTQRRKGVPRYRTLKIGLIRPREELYARIDSRIDGMIEAGWVAEVQALLDAGYNPTLPCFSAIGYRELAAHLQGEIELTEAVTLIKRASRQFVRRQANWFKPDDPTIHWHDMTPSPLINIEKLIKELFLDKSD